MVYEKKLKEKMNRRPLHGKIGMWLDGNNEG
jgi:hypothetical protein